MNPEKGNRNSPYAFNCTDISCSVEWCKMQKEYQQPLDVNAVKISSEDNFEEIYSIQTSAEMDYISACLLHI